MRFPFICVRIAALAVVAAALSITFAHSAQALGPALSSLSVSPTSVVGGSPATGAVALSAPAPSGGVTIALSTSNTAVATTPASVTVPAGASSATFPITTYPVNFNPNVVPPGVSVTVSASEVSRGLPINSVTKSASLTVLTPFVKSVAVWGPITGGYDTAGVVQLTGPAPAGGTEVALASANTAVASVPASVTVAAGSSSASFVVHTEPVVSSTSVDLSAQRGVFNTKSAALTVQPPALAIAACGDPSYSLCHAIGGNTVPVRVWLDGPVAKGATVHVNLSSSQPGVVVAPSSVTVTAGHSNVEFAVATNPVQAATAVTITASYQGVSKTTTIQVLTQHTWRALVLIYRDTDVTYSWQGVTTHFVAHMTDADVQRARDVVAKLPATINQWSNGTADLYVPTIVESSRPIQSVSNYAGIGFWVAPSDVKAELDIYAPPGAYDSVIVIWRYDEAGYNIPAGGSWGLTLAPSGGANGAGYTTVTIPTNHGSWPGYYPEEVFVHEWLHQVSGFFANRGYAVPNPDDSGKYGYHTDANGSWRPYYVDILQGRVWDRSRYIGVTPAIWNSGTPTHG